ncbi:MAG: pyruvate dehydrogenase (acetyl-transferring) E1 component subunit alpha [Myxococcales bacterium]|nr:pyruvate dehydrogenase (acetyl-transferring) E1 component subunit alpha [Myxococcales bacterium]
MSDTLNTTDLTNEQLVEAYRRMLLIRRVEENAGRAYQMQKFSGFCHLYIGQEAVAVATSTAMRDDDYMMTAYREHGQAMSRGVSADSVMAELLGRKTGSTGGRGGSMHIFDKERNFLGGWGIVGGQIPLATGVAWAIKYREEPKVIVVFFGEGSLHQGVFHESLNLASLWDLPIVYLCENNKYAMGTEMSRISAVSDLRKKAVSYDMEAAQIDGQDFFAAYNGIKEAIDRARNESRPTFLDVRTYRFRGHSMSDPATYRTKDELTEEQERDPLGFLYNALVELGAATEEELEGYDKECKKEAKAALKKAEDAPFPDDDSVLDYIYVNP